MLKIKLFSKDIQKKHKKKLQKIFSQDDLDLLVNNFDVQFYLENNIDVKNSGVLPLYHYVIHGEKENRSPINGFVPAEHLDNSSTTIATVNLFLSFLKQNRTLSAIDNAVNESSEASLDVRHFFDEEYYLGQYPDITALGMDAYEHYVKHGWKKGLSPNDWFDVNYYLETHDDIKNANIEPLAHYIHTGKAENRTIIW